MNTYQLMLTAVLKQLARVEELEQMNSTLTAGLEQAKEVKKTAKGKKDG